MTRLPEPEIHEEVPAADYPKMPMVTELTPEQVQALQDGKVIYWDIRGGMALKMESEERGNND